MKTQKRNQGFTLIELMVVITIIAILASITVPVVTKVKAKADLSRDISNARQIVLACKSFASDWDGVYPAWDPDAEAEGGGGGGGEGGDFSTSTDAFNVLIKQGYIDTESIFWMQTKNPEKLRPPRHEGRGVGSGCEKGAPWGALQVSDGGWSQAVAGRAWEILKFQAMIRFSTTAPMKDQTTCSNGRKTSARPKTTASKPI